MNKNTSIHTSSIAGSWYTADPEKLADEINGYLNDAKVETDKKPRLILVPHAGYKYSGPTAAYSYKALAGHHYRNVFIVGVTHTMNFDGISVGDYDSYETPLGDVPVNSDIAEYLMDYSDHFDFVPEAHADEHSLEIQLPFLQTVLSDFQIVPIILSANPDDDPQLLAGALHSILTPDDLVIISSDLSHYPAYKDANEADKKTLEAVLTLKPEFFESALLNREMPLGLSTFACGQKAIMAMIHLAGSLNLQNAELLHYENSGDRPMGDKERVVGYGSVMVPAADEERFSETVVLSAGEKKLLLSIARNSIASHFSGKKTDITIPKGSILNEKLGAFVTLNKHGDLRGCIGNFEPDKPLYQVVADTALSSAFEDPRFSPLSESELKEADIEISVLSPRKKISSYKKIIPGKHGVYVKKGFYAGTYLPQVAPEQDWDREEMMNSLCAHKTGIEQDAWKDGSADLYTYTALVFGE